MARGGHSGSLRAREMKKKMCERRRAGRGTREKEKGKEDREWRGYVNASPCDGNYFHHEMHERERERALGEKEARKGNGFCRAREFEVDRGRIISPPHVRERREKERKMERAHAYVQEISPCDEKFRRERERGK